MKHIIRLFILIAALVLGTDHAWADAESNPRVNFVYVDENGSALSNVPGSAFAGVADNDRKVTITVTINEGQDYRCIDGDLTAEQSINSGNAEARTRTSGEGLGKGVPVPVKFVETNKFTLTLPEDESTNVTVYVKFSEKLEFNPEVTIEDWPYGETANEPSLKANPSSDDVTYTYADAEEGTYTETVPTQAGPHWVKASVAATADYKACESQPVSFAIAKAPLTIKAKDHGILYGNAAANNGVEYSGFVNNEDESVLGGTLTYTYSYDANNDTPGDYEITPSGLTSNNYAITFVPGTLTVTSVPVRVSVTDVADGKELVGAHVQVIKNTVNEVTGEIEETVVEEWTSTTENHGIEGLKTGVEYTLRETVAPEGYTIPADYTFTIDETGQITSTGSVTQDGVLLVENAKTRVEVSVVDIADETALAGATVQVLDGEGNVVKDLEGNDAEWTSGMENHIIEGLKTGVEYTLRETVAPERYAAPADYKFTIAPNGSITFTGNKTNEGVLLVENIELIDVSVTIVWVDGNNQKGFRPENVNVKLFANGAEVEGKTATLRANNEWKYTWTRLNKFADGQEITYTVSQDQLGYYEVPVIEKASETGWSYTVSNRLIDEQAVTEVTVSIVWEDNNNAAGARPKSVEVILEGGNNSQFLKLSANNNWTYTCENLPKYENGVAIDYTVTTLVPISDYSTQITKASDGTFTYTITNKYAPIEKTDICVTIVWEDNNNQSGFRPENVNVKLLADDAEVEGVETATLNADNEWKYTWTGLNKFADDKEIIYTVSQDQLNGYMNPVIEKVSESEWEYKVTNSIISISGVTLTDDGEGKLTATLDPSSEEEVNIPVPVEVDHVNVDRIYVKDKASTVYLPFSIAYNKVTGGKFHTFTGVNETKDPWEVQYTEVTSGNIEANTPYIFLPDGGKITVDNGSDKISVCTANPQTTTQGQWEFIGTHKRIKWTHDTSDPEYTSTREAEIGSVYGFAANDKGNDHVGDFVKVGNNVWINPERAYLKRTTPSSARAVKSGAQTQLPDKMKVVIISANGATTEIGTLDTRTGEISLDEWYSLDGRRLSGKPTKSGVYINNGKKIVVK